MKQIVEIIVYTIAIIVVLLVVGLVNLGLNEMKQSRCEKDGGEFIYNSTDATKSMCRLINKN